MCYIHRKESDAAVRAEELSAAEWIKIAEQAQSRGMLLIYQQLQNGRVPEEILQQIVAEYDVEQAQARDDLQETLAQMLRLGIIEE